MSAQESLCVELRSLCLPLIAIRMLHAKSQFMKKSEKGNSPTNQDIAQTTFPGNKAYIDLLAT